jgi:osmotically-inducible protein OsmY
MCAGEQTAATLDAILATSMPKVIGITTLGVRSMKNFKFAYALVAALALSTMVGCAMGPKQESAARYIDDTVITTGVKTAILNEPTLKVAEINVETYDGVVQLSGFVAQTNDIVTANKVTQGVKGVKSIRNSIRLK